jgi:PAS domain S-box-containing protein
MSAAEVQGVRENSDVRPIVRGRSSTAWVPALIVMALLAAVGVTAAVLGSELLRWGKAFTSPYAAVLFMAAGGAAVLGLMAGFGLATRKPVAGPNQFQPDASRRYSAYWRDTQDGLFAIRVGRDGGFAFEGINPALAARTGLQGVKLGGRRLEQVLGAELAASLSARCRQCVALGAPIDFRLSFDVACGRRHWQVNMAPIRGAKGEIEVLIGSSRDVTEEVALQAALTQSEERFREIAELAPDILFTASPEGEPEYVSPRFFDYTGLPPSTRGRAAFSAVHSDDVSRLGMDADVLSRGPEPVEVRIRGRDGEYRWFLVRVRVVDGVAAPKLYGVATEIDKIKSASAEVKSLNARLTGVLESISDCYYTLDRNWRMTSINPQASAWFGPASMRLLGSDIRPDLKADLQEAISQAFATGRPVHLERQSTYHSDRWIEFHIYPTAEGASVFFGDITERRRAHAEIEEATELLQGSLDAMSAQIALLDETGVIVAVNEAWREAVAEVGLAGQSVGAPYLDFCRCLAPELDEAKVARGLRALLAERRRTFGMAYVLTTPEGVRWRRLRINRFQHGHVLRLIVLHEDVTEVARAQAALRETSERLLTIQDEERQRIAVELHDSTSQHLVALSLGVAKLRRTLDPAAEPVLEDMSGSIAEALKEIRVLSYLLNPPNLERDGLEVTARRFVTGFGARSGLQTLFRAEGDLGGLDTVTQRAVFRVMQEALSNVHRHAAARGAEVDLAVRGGHLVLRIADDGQGIGSLDLGVEGGAQLGVGIAGMRARVAQLDGSLSIVGDQAGTVVEAILPLPRRPNPIAARPAAIVETGMSL